jgi:hypothetical protein
LATDLVNCVGVHSLAGARLADFSGACRRDNPFAAKQAELLAPLDANPGEEGGEAVVIVLAIFLERMMMALGACQPDAEKELPWTSCATNLSNGSFVRKDSLIQLWKAHMPVSCSALLRFFKRSDHFSVQ